MWSLNLLFGHSGAFEHTSCVWGISLSPKAPRNSSSQLSWLLMWHRLCQPDGWWEMQISKCPHEKKGIRRSEFSRDWCGHGFDSWKPRCFGPSPAWALWVTMCCGMLDAYCQGRLQWGHRWDIPAVWLVCWTMSGDIFVWNDSLAFSD